MTKTLTHRKERRATDEEIRHLLHEMVQPRDYDAEPLTFEEEQEKRYVEDYYEDYYNREWEQEMMGAW